MEEKMEYGGNCAELKKQSGLEQSILLSKSILEKMQKLNMVVGERLEPILKPSTPCGTDGVVGPSLSSPAFQDLYETLNKIAGLMYEIEEKIDRADV